MNDKHTAKLNACEASLRRWHTRLTRASNAIAKLVKQRQRLMAKLAQAPAKPVPLVHHDDLAVMPPGAKPPATDVNTDIPPFLKRDTVDVAALAAKRKAKEADAKKKMPLTGKAAIDYVKVKRKKIA